MTLPPHQERILRLRAKGWTQVEIAHEMGLGISTVKNYTNAAYKKLNVTNIAGAFVALGWLCVPDAALLIEEPDFGQQYSTRGAPIKSTTDEE